jgi:hypothetical protein
MGVLKTRGRICGVAWRGRLSPLRWRRDGLSDPALASLPRRPPRLIVDPLTHFASPPQKTGYERRRALTTPLPPSVFFPVPLALPSSHCFHQSTHRSARVPCWYVVCDITHFPRIPSVPPSPSVDLPFPRSHSLVATLHRVLVLSCILYSLLSSTLFPSYISPDIVLAVSFRARTCSYTIPDLASFHDSSCLFSYIHLLFAFLLDYLFFVVRPDPTRRSLLDMDMDACVFHPLPPSSSLPSPSSLLPPHAALRRLRTVLAFLSSPSRSLRLLVATYSNFRREEEKTQQQFFVL